MGRTYRLGSNSLASPSLMDSCCRWHTLTSKAPRGTRVARLSHNVSTPTQPHDTAAHAAALVLDGSDGLRLRAGLALLPPGAVSADGRGRGLAGPVRLTDQRPGPVFPS